MDFQQFRMAILGRFPLRTGAFGRNGPRAPAVCIGLENGAWLCRDGDRFTNGGAPGTAVRLFPDGNVERLPQEES